MKEVEQLFEAENRLKLAALHLGCAERSLELVASFDPRLVRELHIQALGIHAKLREIRRELKDTHP